MRRYYIGNGEVTTHIRHDDPRYYSITAYASVDEPGTVRMVYMGYIEGIGDFSDITVYKKKDGHFVPASYPETLKGFADMHKDTLDELLIVLSGLHASPGQRS